MPVISNPVQFKYTLYNRSLKHRIRECFEKFPDREIKIFTYVAPGRLLSEKPMRGAIVDQEGRRIHVEKEKRYKMKIPAHVQERIQRDRESKEKLKDNFLKQKQQAVSEMNDYQRIAVLKAKEQEDGTVQNVSYDPNYIKYDEIKRISELDETMSNISESELPKGVTGDVQLVETIPSLSEIKVNEIVDNHTVVVVLKPIMMYKKHEYEIRQKTYEEQLSLIRSENNRLSGIAEQVMNLIDESREDANPINRALIRMRREMGQDVFEMSEMLKEARERNSELRDLLDIRSQRIQLIQNQISRIVHYVEDLNAIPHKVIPKKEVEPPVEKKEDLTDDDNEQCYEDPFPDAFDD